MAVEVANTSYADMAPAPKVKPVWAGPFKGGTNVPGHERTVHLSNYKIPQTGPAPCSE